MEKYESNIWLINKRNQWCILLSMNLIIIFVFNSSPPPVIEGKKDTYMVILAIVIIKIMLLVNVHEILHEEAQKNIIPHSTRWNSSTKYCYKWLKGKSTEDTLIYSSEVFLACARKWIWNILWLTHFLIFNTCYFEFLLIPIK